MPRDAKEVTLTEEQIQQARSGMQMLLSAFPFLLSLEPAERKSLKHFGPQSEVFCRRTLQVLEQNPQIVPPSLDVAGGRKSLVSRDSLQPILEQLQAFTAMLDDTCRVLGSDAMEVALDGYGQLNLQGDAFGLEELRREIGQRWAKNRRRRTSVPAKE